MEQIRLAAIIAAGALTWTGLCLGEELLTGAMALLALGLIGSDELAEEKGGEYGE